jgi:hypothetical protein
VALLSLSGCFVDLRRSRIAYGHLEAELSDANGDKLKTVPLATVSVEK